MPSENYIVARLALDLVQRRISNHMQDETCSDVVLKARATPSGHAAGVGSVLCAN
jgi:hypothetical protein